MKKFIVVLSFLALTAVNTFGQTEDVRERASLRGLAGVYVVFTDLEDDIKKDGLTEQQLRTDVELRLRRAGIRVLTLDEVRESSAKPTLVISVETVKSDPLSKLLEGSVYAFSLSIQLRQIATLKRMPTNEFLVTTWSDNAFGFATVKTLKVIRDGLGDYVDKFANDFLTVNPK